MTYLEFKGVSKIFYDNDDHENYAVNKADLLVDKGELVVFVGPSGCGKSTLLRMIAGLEDIDEGEIILDDIVVNEVEVSKREVAMVFQDYALYPHMTVDKNLSFGLENTKIKQAEIDEKVDYALNVLELGTLKERLPKQLSGGQRQRVALGRALVKNPKVFLLDEPLSNLDARLRVQTRKLISDLHKQLQATMIYVTHDQIEAMTLGDKIVVMNHGVIQQVGTPEEIYQEPSNTFVANFIGTPSMNLLHSQLSPSGSVQIGETVIPLPTELVEKAKAFVGKEVIVGIRPEDITLIDQEEGLKPELVEYLGSENIVYFNTPQGELVVKSNVSQRLDSEVSYQLIFNSEKIYLFNSQSGIRI
ncbi:ABC transporter ATP-binding protein [Fundicoccus culcitae]|uniref:ATP-binding cassette domain-containing protein n=1 Tax=Fundicoccus culcitae TaxID=2969821 RepID=A0ABY5P3P0_9LACT|nr:ATP-binding cassette domain-containing protein [Fundicoccus culcitae]UUX33356.1 ATP-binding cassette domain-containing protein [Fundicoccus culcitae]